VVIATEKVQPLFDVGDTLVTDYISIDNLHVSLMGMFVCTMKTIKSKINDIWTSILSE
ncbi:hypothetical protein ACJX0J_038921, partial [Zea mays]